MSMSGEEETLGQPRTCSRTQFPKKITFEPLCVRLCQHKHYQTKDLKNWRNDSWMHGYLPCSIINVPNRNLNMSFPHFHHSKCPKRSFFFFLNNSWIDFACYSTIQPNHWWHGRAVNTYVLICPQHISLFTAIPWTVTHAFKNTTSLYHIQYLQCLICCPHGS